MGQCKGTNCEANIGEVRLQHSPECIDEYLIAMKISKPNREKELELELHCRALSRALDISMNNHCVEGVLGPDSRCTPDWFVEIALVSCDAAKFLGEQSQASPTPKQELKFSEQLKQNHDCGDFGDALDGENEAFLTTDQIIKEFLS